MRASPRATGEVAVRFEIDRVPTFDSPTKQASAPIPIRTFLDDPPVLLGLALPYAWIVSICVAGALAGHAILLRALLRRPG